MRLSDHQIVESLIARDAKVTHDFFYVWCRPLIFSLTRKVFGYEVDYDELVNELYVYLLEDDARRLRTFRGRSSIYQWLKCVAARFFIGKRDSRTVMEDSSSEPPYPGDEPRTEPVKEAAVKADVRRMLALMDNPRYRTVLERLMIEEVDYKTLAAEMNTSVANLYNIKKRAWTEFTAIVLKEYGQDDEDNR